MDRVSESEVFIYVAYLSEPVSIVADLNNSWSGMHVEYLIVIVLEFRCI